MKFIYLISINLDFILKDNLIKSFIFDFLKKLLIKKNNKF